MKNNWDTKNFEECIEKVVYTRKVQKKHFLESGQYPIISQEDKFINGYWNNKKDIFKVKSPVVIFGDHTQILKYVDFDFVLGADGVKILQPKAFLDPKYFYYFLKSISLKQLGYARHYKLLKKIRVLYPKSLDEQKEIVTKLDKFASQVSQLENTYKQILVDTEELKKSVIKKTLNGGK